MQEKKNYTNTPTTWSFPRHLLCDTKRAVYTRSNRIQYLIKSYKKILVKYQRVSNKKKKCNEKNNYLTAKKNVYIDKKRKIDILAACVQPPRNRSQKFHINRKRRNAPRPAEAFTVPILFSFARTMIHVQTCTLVAHMIMSPHNHRGLRINIPTGTTEALPRTGCNFLRFILECTCLQKKVEMSSDPVVVMRAARVDMLALVRRSREMMFTVIYFHL